MSATFPQRVVVFGVAAAQPLAALSDGTFYFATDTQTLSASDGNSWAVIASGAAAVSSVAGRTGAVVLAESDVTGLVSDLAAKAPSTGIAESAVTNLVSDLAAKAPLASPALTGNPTAPTQTAGNNSTRLATTAYADAAAAGAGAVTSVAGRTGAVVLAESDITSLTGDLAAKAPLASPTFTGTPSLPTGTTGTTQAAADNTTKLATTAYADAAAAARAPASGIAESAVTNLVSDLSAKAPLASPALTGHPTGVTETAGDNSTRLASTAYADAAAAARAPASGIAESAVTNLTTDLAAKAPLASPTFTGTVTLPSGIVLPSGVTAPTQTDGDNSTKVATTAYVDAHAQRLRSYYYNGANTNIAETMLRDAGISFNATTTIAAAGIQNNYAILLYAGMTVTNITFRVGSTGATFGTTPHWYVALYDTQATPALLANSSDKTNTGLGVSTTQLVALTSPYSVTATGLYYVSIMINTGAGGTQPTVFGNAAGTSNSSSGLVTGQKVLSQTSGSGITTTVPSTIASPSANAQIAYVVTS